MKSLLIYRITNSVNGKVYIGQTRQGLERRKAEHMSRLALGERDHKLYQAMRKYGAENFTFDVLFYCLNVGQLSEMEKHFIKEFNSFEAGYNMTCGDVTASDETREKISAKLKGRKIFWLGKIIATRKCNRALGLEKDPKEFVAHGAANVNSKRYLITAPDGKEIIIDGLNAFCKDRGLTKKCLFDIIDGKQKHHKGYSLFARFNDQRASA